MNLTEIPDTPDADSQRSLHTHTHRERERERERERANMHWQGIACTRSFCVGLTSAEGLKPEYFE